jgi:hypothetical protein
MSMGAGEQDSETGVKGRRGARKRPSVSSES